MHTEVNTYKLYFEGKPIALLSSIFENQGTWYSTYSLLPDVATRLNDFVNFSKTQLPSQTWDEGELSKFDDIVNSPDWNVVGQDLRHQLDGCPLFDGNEISWRKKE